MYFDLHPSPVGPLLLTASETGLQSVSMLPESGAHRVEAGWQRSPEALSRCRTQLDEYFSGARQRFELDLDPQGTAFQLDVWQALRAIPYGHTASYGEIARRVGRPKASRAVGAANNQNPISIIVPCHRVIGANGTLVGFGGGLPRKRILLTLESGQQSYQLPLLQVG
ncbi:MAG: methylated-DNA--[protein]-cysteine S-methyltransferase [Myxococcota bacterium]